jgi:hypothetical protein
MAQERAVRSVVRVRFVLAWVLLVTVSTVGFAADAPTPKADPSVPPQLMLRLNRTSTVVLFDRVAVEWQLENIGKTSVHVCQWPGIAFSQHWECPNGQTKAGVPGYPDSRSLDRKYFLELKPGEALVGYGRVDVWPTPSGRLSLGAEFRCDQEGREYGLAAWKGRLSSDLVSVEVPKDPKAKACEP